MIHRYILPMKIISVESKTDARHVRVDLGQSVSVVFELPGIDEIKGMRLVLETNDKES